MTTLDPSTNRPLPPDAIQRILHITPTVHIYAIPPLTSTKGFSASSWTGASPTAKQIFTARLRVIETSIQQTLKTDIVLEDAATGDLFAAAPYTSPAVVQQALDSSRFFALRVVGEGGLKATLGLGFEERSEAFDFSIVLGDVRKVLGFEQGAAAAAGAVGKAKGKKGEEERRDFSLKEGESIHVEIGGRSRRGKAAEVGESEGAALFSIPPPPGQGGMPMLAPPPSASQVRSSRSPSPNEQHNPAQQSAQDLGFDDGEFGEFQ